MDDFVMNSAIGNRGKTILIQWLAFVQSDSSSNKSDCLDEEPLFSSQDDNSVYQNYGNST